MSFSASFFLSFLHLFEGLKNPGQGTNFMSFPALFPYPAALFNVQKTLAKGE